MTNSDIRPLPIPFRGDIFRRMFQTVPRAPLLLGLAGLLPFLWGALTVLFPDLARWTVQTIGPRFAGPYVMLFYGAVILSFMSGVLWGFATKARGTLAATGYALSVLPALWAFFMTGGGPVAAGMSLIFGFAGLLGAFIRKRETMPFVVTEHAVYWKEVDRGAVALECGLPVSQSDNEQSANFKDTFRNIARAVYGKADYTVSVARSNIPDQQRLGADPVAYIPNGVDVEYLRGDLSAEADRPSLTVGWVGRCAHIKQPLRFLDLAGYIARQQSQSRYPEVNFRMYLSRAGEEELEKEVAQRAAGIPGLTLYWDRPAKQAMRGLDALCISSISEAQPLVALEAIAAKALPFGWQCGDLDSELGYFFPQHRPVGEIANKLVELWREPLAWESEVEQLFETVKAEHTWQQIFRQYRELFDALAEPSNASEDLTT